MNHRLGALSICLSLLLMISGSRAFAVIGGAQVSADDSIAQSTVFIASHGLACTGVVFSETLILTAAHCVSKSPEGPGVAPDDKVVVYFGDVDPGKIDPARVRMLHGRDIFVNPGYTGLLNSGAFKGKFNDIALVHIEQGLPPGFHPAKIGWEANDLAIGRPAFVAGFGPDKAEYAASVFSLRRLAVRIDGLLKEPGQILIRSTEANGGMARGDSGGPAFFSKPDGPEVFALCSFGMSGEEFEASSLDGYEPISQHRAWIEATAKSISDKSGNDVPKAL